jgi:hypothetical protein
MGVFLEIKVMIQCLQKSSVNWTKTPIFSQIFWAKIF